MTSVTQRIKQIKQPRGGYINPKLLQSRQLGDGSAQSLDHKIENCHPSIVGIAVDYLTRLASGTSAEVAFNISMRGAALLQAIDGAHLPRALDLLSEMAPRVRPSDDAIRAALRLVSYDVVFRAGAQFYVDAPVADDITVNHVREMLERSLAFFAEYGPVTEDGFLPVTALSKTPFIDSGDGDFLTEDTLWDFKVSVASPTASHTLQLAIYALMGRRTGFPQYESITRLGIFNPRLNTVSTIELSTIPPEILGAIELDVIGYDRSSFSG